LPLMHDISRILINEERLGNIRICRINNVKSDDYYIDQNINNWLIEWENGSLKDLGDNTELMYFHFIKSKNLNKFRISEFKDQSIFRISQYGIKS